MANLDAPEDVEDLYDARGEEVAEARPIFQGDVFSNIFLPGISKAPQLAMVTSHPCSMRKGSQLAPRVTMTSIGSRSDPIALKKWKDSFYSIMPLPQLLPAEDDKPFRFVDFAEVSSVESASLVESNRIACLSEHGVQLLQQRQIFFSTRVSIQLGVIYRELAPLFAEIELQQDWVEAALEHASATATELLLDDAVREFQEFLGDGRSERRSLLKDEARRSIVRKDVRQQIISRFGKL